MKVSSRLEAKKIMSDAFIDALKFPQKNVVDNLHFVSVDLVSVEISSAKLTFECNAKGIIGDIQYETVIKYRRVETKNSAGKVISTSNVPVSEQVKVETNLLSVSEPFTCEEIIAVCAEDSLADAFGSLKFAETLKEPYPDSISKSIDKKTVEIFVSKSKKTLADAINQKGRRVIDSVRVRHGRDFARDIGIESHSTSFEVEKGHYVLMWMGVISYGDKQLKVFLNASNGNLPLVQFKKLREPSWMLKIASLGFFVPTILYKAVLLFSDKVSPERNNNIMNFIAVTALISGFVGIWEIVTAKKRRNVLKRNFKTLPDKQEVKEGNSIATDIKDKNAA